jgi:penicillin-binding protein 1C
MADQNSDHETTRPEGQDNLTPAQRFFGTSEPAESPFISPSGKEFTPPGGTPAASSSPRVTMPHLPTPPEVNSFNTLPSPPPPTFAQPPARPPIVQNMPVQNMPVQNMPVQNVPSAQNRPSAHIEAAPATVGAGCLGTVGNLFGLRSKNPTRRGCGLAALGCLISLFLIFSVSSCSLLVAGAILWTNLSKELGDKIDQAQKAAESETFQTTHVYDRNGNELHQIFSEGRRTKIKLADIPKSVIDATISVEDKTFYDNPGVEPLSIIRAVLANLHLGYASQGASTITQQLVRNIAFDYKDRVSRTTQRKIEEVIMAMILTREKSKDEILEMYLNEIYYGNFAYGIEAAAKTYFGKSAKDLTLAEASLLAGLPQAPADYDPLNPDPQVQDDVYQRHKVVLDLMVDAGKITRDEADKALAQNLSYANPNVNLKSPHFTLYAEDELKTLLPAINIPASYVNTGGLSVYTTLDLNIEGLAENSVRQQIALIRDKNNADNAAVVVIQPGTGEILAMVGSVNYNDENIKGKVNVTTALRQPGSSIKPITYSAGFERGMTPGSILWDVPLRLTIPGSGTYAPVNYDGHFRGPVHMRDALANSLNIPALETLGNVGVPAFLEIANRFGIRSLGNDPSKYGLSITLGGADVSPLELAQAYTVFATGGNFVPATSILCIINSDGKIVYQYEKGCGSKGTADDKTINASANPKLVLDPRIAFMISDVLGDNAARSPEMGANSPLRTDGITSSAKTGTTNDFRDNWTVGFTHNIVVGVWVGNTDNSPMRNSTGLTGAAPIWHDVITGIYGNNDMLNSLKVNGNLRPDALTPPDGLVRKPECDLSSLHDPAPDCARGRAEWQFSSPPLVPDASGKLVPNSKAIPTQAPGNGPIVTDVEPSVAQALVFHIDPSYAATLVGTSNDPNHPAVPPSYCLVPNEVKAQVPTATTQVFIKPPLDPQMDLWARAYAQGGQIPILPNLACNADMLGRAAQNNGIVAIIQSPHPGDTVTKLVQVSGTVTWGQNQATYFKMEIQGPQFPTWTTFGAGDGIHRTQVINGPLDTFGAEGLQPGTYQLHIVVVGMDGNYAYTSPSTPVNVTGQ